MRPCLQRLEDVYGHQSHFFKIGIKTHFKITNFAIFTVFKKQFPPSEPDFYAISKMVHYISVPQKLTELLSKMSISTHFILVFQNDSGDLIHPPIFSKWVSSFPQEFILSTINVLDQIYMYKVPKIVKMCQFETIDPC